MAKLTDKHQKHKITQAPYFKLIPRKLNIDSHEFQYKQKHNHQVYTELDQISYQYRQLKGP